MDNSGHAIAALRKEGNFAMRRSFSCYQPKIKTTLEKE
jgi:hypothetical protein